MSLPSIWCKHGSQTNTSQDNYKRYPELSCETVNDVYKLLPINGRTRLFVDQCGIYYPDRDKKVGSCYVKSAFDFTEDYIYIVTW